MVCIYAISPPKESRNLMTKKYVSDIFRKVEQEVLNVLESNKAVIEGLEEELEYTLDVLIESNNTIEHKNKEIEKLREDIKAANALLFDLVDEVEQSVDSKVLKLENTILDYKAYVDEFKQSIIWLNEELEDANLRVEVALNTNKAFAEMISNKENNKVILNGAMDLNSQLAGVVVEDRDGWPWIKLHGGGRGKWSGVATNPVTSEEIVYLGPFRVLKPMSLVEKV